MNAAALVEIAAKSLAIGAVGAALLCLPRVRSGAPGRRLAGFVIAALLALPVATLAGLPRIELPVSPSSLGAALGGRSFGLRLSQIVALLWLAGAAGLLAREAAGQWRLRRWLAGSRSIESAEWRDTLDDCRRRLGWRGRIELCEADTPSGPFATGLWRRRIVLPASAHSWSDGGRRIVLLHELVHFQRGDLWIAAAARLACALHWFNPFVWLIQRWLEQQREMACDASVVARGIERTDYAELLLVMAAPGGPQVPRPALAMARGGQGKLEARLRRLLTPPPPLNRIVRAFEAILTLAASVVAAAALVLSPATRHQAPPSPGSSSSARPADEVPLRLTADPFPGNTP